MAGHSVKRALPKQGYAPDLNKYLARKLRLKLRKRQKLKLKRKLKRMLV